MSSRTRSRAEALVQTILVWNGLLVFPIYALGLTNVLTRWTLGPIVAVTSAAILARGAVRGGAAAYAKALARRVVALTVLPLEGVVRAAWRGSLTTVGAALAALLFPYMLVAAYLAPAWRDWDALWYHETLTGFTIQEHGFRVLTLPSDLELINGVHRLCEMTQLWFALWGGRRVIDVAGVMFLPLLAASMFLLARRYTRDVVAGVAWASALVLFPGVVRLVQSTMVDTQACALLLAAAYFVTHPRLDRTNAAYAVLGLTLAAGAKIWSIVPVGILSLVLLVRVIRRRKENGARATAAILSFGSAAVVGIQLVTYLRNWILFGNPLWPMVKYDNARLGIHWKGSIALGAAGGHLNVSFNEPFDVFYAKMLAAPFTMMGPGHVWQLNDYGFAYAWLVFPLAALATVVLLVRFVGGAVGRIFGGARARAGPGERVASALVLALTGGTSLYLSPAIHIARYHIASLGMLIAAICWLSASGRRRGARLALGAALVVQVSSVLTLYWAPARAPWIALYTPSQLLTWLRTPYPAREFTDLGGSTTPPLVIAPITLDTGLAREREVHEGDVVAFHRLDFPALLWNSDFSNRVVWLSAPDGPGELAEAERIGAVWVYAELRSPLGEALAKAPARWEIVGPLQTKGVEAVWRKRSTP